MRGQTSAPAHSYFDQKLARFNGKTIISLRACFLYMQGFFPDFLQLPPKQ